jgi:hypothetical protein
MILGFVLFYVLELFITRSVQTSIPKPSFLYYDRVGVLLVLFPFYPLRLVPFTFSI